MLNTFKSKIIYNSKFVIIAPAILLALMSFNTERTYKSEEIKTILFNESEVTAIINKDDSDAYLEALVKTFAVHNVTLKIDQIKRNASKEISAISIDVRANGKTLKYNKDANTPISPIRISFNANTNNINVEESKPISHTFMVRTNKTSEDGNTTIRIQSANSENESIVELDKDNKLLSLTTDGEKTSLNKKGNFIAWSEEYKPKDMNTENTSSPLIFIDGNKTERSELDTIDPNTIEKMNILKGEKAIEKYGKDAKDGVIEVTLK